MQQPQYTQPRRGSCVLRALLISGVLICLVCVALVAFGYYLGQQFDEDLATASTAYTEANCAEAVELYTSLLDHSSFENLEPAEQERHEAQFEACDHYQDGLEAQDEANYASALYLYTTAITFINEARAATADEATTATATTDDPVALRAVIDERLQTLFEEQTAKDFANATLCEQMIVQEDGTRQTNLTTIIAADVIPQPDENIPALLIACGNYLVGEGEYALATSTLGRFLDSYPDHPRAGEAEDLMGEAIVGAAEAAGAASIEQPEALPGGEAGVATLWIQNASPQDVRITLVGQETVVEELPACETCQTYTGNGPEICPDEGTEGIYTVPPGPYNVVVESGSGDDVVPFRGTWSLEAGMQYPQCFFIVTTFE